MPPTSGDSKRTLISSPPSPERALAGDPLHRRQVRRSGNATLRPEHTGLGQVAALRRAIEHDDVLRRVDRIGLLEQFDLDRVAADGVEADAQHVGRDGDQLARRRGRRRRRRRRPRITPAPGAAAVLGEEQRGGGRRRSGPVGDAGGRGGRGRRRRRGIEPRPLCLFQPSHSRTGTSRTPPQQGAANIVHGDDGDEEGRKASRRGRADRRPPEALGS